jgi:hypothetical protein
MKIRSLLLGSVAAAGLATTGFAADLGVVTSLDICDELGLSGLTISSDDNCLVITGGVTFEYKIGDYDPGVVYTTFNRSGNNYEVDDNDGILESNADVDAWLKFEAAANSDFGKATATIKLISENITGLVDAPVLIDEAWVGIGDTTQLMAGYKGSIFNDGDDGPLNYLGLFNSSDVDAGVGFSASNARGGDVIQIKHDLGSGLVIKGGIEDLGSVGVSLLTGVGVIEYAGDGVTAHASASIDTVGLFNVHTGFKGTWDPITVVGAVAVNNGWWNALGSVSATFDMFTIALSGEATSAGDWGVGGSVAAALTDGVKINLGSRFYQSAGFPDVWQAEAGIEADATETIKVTAAIGVIDGTADPLVFYGKAGLAWDPSGGFTSSISGRAQSNGAYSATFTAAKSIK